jgi:hypothetical protein
MNALTTLQLSLRVLVRAAPVLFVLLHARAATFTVTSTADTGDPGTLRNAITQANSDATTSWVINFNVSGGAAARENRRQPRRCAIAELR